MKNKIPKRSWIISPWTFLHICFFYNSESRM